MLLKDRFVETFMEKFGLFGILAIVTFVIVTLIVAVILGAYVKSKLSSPHDPSPD